MKVHCIATARRWTLSILYRAVLRGEIVPELTTNFLGQTYSAPFGIAPVGMSGLMWPGAEKALASFAC